MKIHGGRGYGSTDPGYWVDVNDPVAVEIKITSNRIWINVEGVCVLRIFDPGTVQVVDERAEDGKEDPD